MGTDWRRAVTHFALFNLIAVPLGGRLAWQAMIALNTERQVGYAVFVSVLIAFTVLAANVVLSVLAARRGAPRPALAGMWGWTVATFALTVGAGFFSPLNLLAALVTH